MGTRPALIVLDTGFLFAFLSTDDARHAAAMTTVAEIADGKWGQPVVSDLVFAELLNLLRARKAPPDRERTAMLALTGASPAFGSCRSIPAPVGDDAQAALDTFTKHRQLSFTDAALLVEVRRHARCRLATFDSGFKGLCDTVP